MPRCLSSSIITHFWVMVGLFHPLFLPLLSFFMWSSSFIISIFITDFLSRQRQGFVHKECASLLHPETFPNTLPLHKNLLHLNLFLFLVSVSSSILFPGFQYLFLFFHILLFFSFDLCCIFHASNSFSFFISSISNFFLLVQVSLFSSMNFTVHNIISKCFFLFPYFSISFSILCHFCSSDLFLISLISCIFGLLPLPFFCLHDFQSSILASFCIIILFLSSSLSTSILLFSDNFSRIFFLDIFLFHLFLQIILL